MQVLSFLVIDALRELSDETEQAALWTSDGAGGSEVSSLIECRCRLFDDSGLGDQLARGGAYTPDIDQDLRLLRAELERIDASRSPAAILSDRQLVNVRSRAASLLDHVLEHTRDDRDGTDPWFLPDAAVVDGLVAQAKREIRPGHALYGLQLTLVAKCSGCDDVVYRCGENGFAIVHLSWSDDVSPPWPTTARYGSLIAAKVAMDRHAH